MSLLRSLSRRAAAGAAVLALAPVAPLAAQQAPSAPPPQPVERNSIATNILGIPFGIFSAEYERALSLPGLTFGIGGSYLSDDLEDNDSGDGTRNVWASAKVQYYPGERAFRGFSVGLTAGVHSARGVACDDDFLSGCGRGVPTRQTQTAPTLGAVVNYDRILGSRERFRVGIGVGAKRVLRDVRESRDVLEQVYPDGRFVVGFTF